MVPGETCVKRPERGNRGHIRKVTLSAQESAEAIVPKLGRAEVMQSGVTGERRTAWREQKTPKAAAACKGIARNAKSIHCEVSPFHRRSACASYSVRAKETLQALICKVSFGL